jgi:hypothetical protein
MSLRPYDDAAAENLVANPASRVKTIIFIIACA